MAAMRGEAVLGSRGRWGAVGYAGRAFAPARGTYRAIDATRAHMTTVQDSGRVGTVRETMANLYPLLAAALYEAAFAGEFGPLSTWAN